MQGGDYYHGCDCGTAADWMLLNWVSLQDEAIHFTESDAS